MTINKDDNIVCIDSGVISIMRHLIKACQGYQYKEYSQNELIWAKDILDNLVNKINDENTQIAYSEEARERLISVCEHLKEQLYN